MCSTTRTANSDPPRTPPHMMVWPSMRSSEIAEYVVCEVLGTNRGSVGYNIVDDALICYLPLTQFDWDHCPALVGAEEIWVMIDVNDERMQGYV